MSEDVIDKRLLTILGYIGRFFPKISFVPDDNTHWIINDPVAVEKFRNDPLIYHGSVPLRYGQEAFNRLIDFQNEMEDYPLSFFIGHSQDDHLTDIAGSKMLYSRARAEDKELKIYQGLYHEIFHEDAYQMVLDDFVHWIYRFIN